nr:uncharacterized protein LOC131764166 [Kogia breviceps]
MHFITEATPDIRRKLQKLEAGPQTPLSTLVVEALKVYSNRDLREEANKNKRLIKKRQLLAALIHPPPHMDPGGPRRLDRPPRSCLGQNQSAFCCVLSPRLLEPHQLQLPHRERGAPQPQPARGRGSGARPAARACALKVRRMLRVRGVRSRREASLPRPTLRGGAAAICWFRFLLPIKFLKKITVILKRAKEGASRPEALPGGWHRAAETAVTPRPGGAVAPGGGRRAARGRCIGNSSVCWCQHFTSSSEVKKPYLLLSSSIFERDQITWN